MGEIINAIKIQITNLSSIIYHFFLTSCGDSASNPTTPSNQVTDNSTNKPSVPSINTDKKDTTTSSNKKMMQVHIGTHQKKK